jgi:hypothetical protein
VNGVLWKKKGSENLTENFAASGGRLRRCLHKNFRDFQPLIALRAALMRFATFERSASSAGAE